jgi:hypothetical protein
MIRDDKGAPVKDKDDDSRLSKLARNLGIYLVLIVIVVILVNVFLEK